jgi:hypothetical protein
MDSLNKRLDRLIAELVAQWEAHVALVANRERL